MPRRTVLHPLLHAFSLPAALCVAAAAHAGDPIVIGTIAADRSADCGTIDFSFVADGYFSTVRSALDSNANFGPGGIVGRDIVFAPPISVVTNEALQGIDILFVTPVQPALGSCEVAAIGNFLAAGGGVFAFANDAAANLASIVGASAGPIGTGSGLVIPGRPMSAGPFGKVTGRYGLSFHRVFGSLGKSGQPCLQSNGVVAAAFTRGLGRLIIVNDEEWCGDQSLDGCAVSWMPSAPRLAMFLNAVAWVAPPSSFTFVEPGPSPDLDCDGDVDAFDLAILLNAWGTCTGCRADIDRNGQVNGQDLAILLVNWSA
jgi:hypothetical protein